MPKENTRLFVGNLPNNLKDDSLRSHFSLYGEVKNLELKSKNDDNAKKFAFITLFTTDEKVESCIKHFSCEPLEGSKLYVTRARESFLERLQRERQETEEKASQKQKTVTVTSPKVESRKRKVDQNGVDAHPKSKKKPTGKHDIKIPILHKPAKRTVSPVSTSGQDHFSETNKKKQDSDKKRLESMKRKMQEFKERKTIIKTGLIGIDTVKNKKLVFKDDDYEEDSTPKNWSHDVETPNEPNHAANKNLFDDEDSDGDINFEIKKQFEGQKGQKVLELQSRYKSDNRFVLDERFQENEEVADEEIEPSQLNERDTQLNILQDVLGVSFKTKPTRNIDETQNKKKANAKLGMLRFDPMQPEHSKFLAPVEEKKQEPTKLKKKKNKEIVEDVKINGEINEVPKVEVSKEQFYKVADTLKEALVQTNSFSLRSLFGAADDDKRTAAVEQEDYVPIEKPKAPKTKNPLDPGERNPFKYDSSDSEDEYTPANQANNTPAPNTELKAVWKENLFFTANDHRLLEGLSFFNMKSNSEGVKDRRELKTLMKKRITNKNRKDQMFKKKIGGKRKSHKKSFRKNYY